PRTDSLIHAMPAFLMDQDIVAMKWVSAYSANRERGLPYISGVIVLNDADTGEPIALMDAAEITAARTAAVSGVCMRHFAPQDCKRIGIVGFGEQGRYHARLVRNLYPDALVVTYNPNSVSVGDLGVESCRSAR